MNPECFFSVPWTFPKTDPPCPPCNEVLASHIWPDYYRDFPRESNRRDLYLCAAHASWLMDRSTLALPADQDRLIAAVATTPVLGDSQVEELIFLRWVWN